MTLHDILETDLDIPCDHPQRQLFVAYTRLFLLPKRADGSQRTIIASYGAYDIRLTEVSMEGKSVPPLWIELYDGLSGQVIDSAGCRNLQDAGAAVEKLTDEALRLAGVSRH